MSIKLDHEANETTRYFNRREHCCRVIETCKNQPESGSRSPALPEVVARRLTDRINAKPRDNPLDSVTLPLAGFAVTLVDVFFGMDGPLRLQGRKMADPLVAENESASLPARTGERLLIVRLSAMGDLIHGIPVINALRRAMPEAMLGWVAEGRNADLLAGHPALDQLIRVPRRWLKSPQAVVTLRRELRRLRFDTVVDLQCLTKSAVAAWLSGAPRRIGYAGKLGREASRFFHNELVAVDAVHVIDRYLALLKPLGIDSPAVEFNLPESAEDAAFAERSLRELGLANDGFAIVNPGAGWASKRWPAERYGQLATQLSAQHGLPTLAVWGGADELPLAEQIVAASGGAAQLAPATTMTQLGALARRAKIFVGSDTGPLHLAVAVGTRSISLHGTSLAEQTGAYGPQNRRLQVRCDDSRGKRRHDDDSAMCAIDVETVLAACTEILGEAINRNRPAAGRLRFSA